MKLVHKGQQKHNCRKHLSVELTVCVIDEIPPPATTNSQVSRKLNPEKLNSASLVLEQPMFMNGEDLNEVLRKIEAIIQKSHSPDKLHLKRD